MSYPDYPNNKLIVNNVDLTQTYGLVLSDGYTLEPPTIKTYTVDIPGGNGKLDLTETLLGDTAYGNRKQEFIFYVINVENFEQVKTQISNLLHGRAFDYTITMDPDYTYHGRFTVLNYQHSRSNIGKIGAITISVDADPFKYKEPRTLLINAVGGRVTIIESGRKRVRPSIQTATTIKVIYNNKLVMLYPGTWTLNDLFFTFGENELYLNSYDIHNLTWGDLRTDATTWGTFGETRLFEWYKSKGTINIEYRQWSEFAETTWDTLSASTWSDLTRVVGIPEDIEDVYVKYDWGDL